MARSLVKFACTLRIGAANIEAACQLYHRLAMKQGDHDGDFAFSITHLDRTSPDELLIASDDNGKPREVLLFVSACAEKFALIGNWGFILTRWPDANNPQRFSHSRSTLPGLGNISGFRRTTG